ncbi:GNAT family N-acetyltransferase [Aurantiacibacter rhizosphaerae]|uniref:GNAT family N-acetyltransferase n=1 Tax=Aurantiacibacter rhizosphaerae TaxID=2691582 RepID=A0A844X9U7_9SPHN|nr:N-acetyltransferase [Aurantiacibacter rhizosphaerae]MWV26559.1 GNAT family N-acetyltransferase [Aurantiacibacter rhizosphaerae]
MSWSIREEAADHTAAIRAMTLRAFTRHPHSDGSEADVIDRLREDGDLVLSLVAVDGAQILGQATYSAAKLSSGEEGWMVLGPISVEPKRQGEGIGRALLEAGEEEMRARGAKGITVLGDPQIYSRFGYVQHTPLGLEGELGEYLQVKSFGAPIPSATIRYAPAFGPDFD